MKKIGVVGAGNVGTTLALALQEKGYPLLGFCCRTEESTRRAAGLLGCPSFSRQLSRFREADLIFITTPDRSIEPVCRQLAREGAFRRGQIVLHTSGAHSSAILKAAREAGAYCLSMHPLQTFPSVEAGRRNLPGSYFTLEGDEEALAEGMRMVEMLGGIPLTIPTSMKPLYHAAACVACNYYITLVEVAVEMLEHSGVPREQALPALLPLLQGTLANIARVGVPGALTGPIDRGTRPPSRPTWRYCSGRCPGCWSCTG